jgi:hypothetical protein
VRGYDVGVRVARAQLVGHGSFVASVAERMEQADGDRLRVDLGERGEIQRLELAFGPEAAADAVAALERHERRRMVEAGSVEVRPRLPPEVEQVLEPGVRDEPRARAPPLEQRVRRDRGAVREAIELVRARRAGGRDNGLLLPPRRQDLRDPYVAVGHEDGVRERPADVDPQRLHGGILTADRS